MHNKIPDGWTQTSLKNIFQIKNGKTDTVDAVETGAYPLFDRSTVVKKSDKYLFDCEAIILPGEGQDFSPRYYRGKFDLHQRAYALSPKLNTVNVKFFYYAITNSRKILFLHAVGSTVKSLRMSIIENMEVLVPPKAEQEKIAEILTTVDENIEKTDKIIARCEKVKNGLMQTLLLNGTAGKHKKFKKTALGEIPEKWDIKKLDAIGVFLKGKGISKSQLLEEGIPCVRYGELYTVHHFEIKKFYSFINKETASESEPLKNTDLLLAGSGETIEEIGKCAVFLGNEEAYTGGDIIIFRDHHQDGLYMSYLLNSNIVRQQLNKLGQGHAVVHIYPRQLSGVVVPLPPLNEQKEISATFSILAKRLEAENERKISLLKLKQALMQKLLSGELKVKVN